MQTTQQTPSKALIITAFAIVYIVWGSTYFFIQIAVKHIPPFLVGAIRFTISGALMLLWCMIRKEKAWEWKQIYHSSISGILMLFGGMGCLIWAEQVLPTAMCAILVSAAPIWFVLLDFGHWKINFNTPSSIAGLVLGFAGILLLFGEQLNNSLGAAAHGNIMNMVILVSGSVLWSAGSLYSKYKTGGSSTSVNTAWQMLAAGICFLPFAALHHEFDVIKWVAVPASAWYAIAYLVIFGSIVAFSAYVWLLEVRPATQVSTYAYVNPVIAVILGVLFAKEHISWLQITGLLIILGSVLLINLAKYRYATKDAKHADEAISRV